MVFDWFKRAAVPAPAQAPEAAEGSAEGGGAVEAAAASSEESAPEAEAGGAAPTPESERAAEASQEPAGAPAAAAPAPAGAAAAPAAVDQDALDWARQAYARLKAQQEAAAAVAQAAASPEAPDSLVLQTPAPAEQAASAPATAAGEPVSSPPAADGGALSADIPASPSAPAFSAAPPSSDTPEQSVPEAPAAPSATAASESALAAQAAPLPEPEPAAASAPPSPPVASAPEEAQGSQAAAEPSPAPPLSLLERAAAERQQRRQQILEAAAAAGAEPAAAAPAIPAPGMAPAVVPPPAVAEPAASAADQAEPSLGAFDADFTWSAEVLAAQGRKVEEVSLEEIDWLTRLRRGLEKTRRGFVAQLLDTLGDDPLSADTLDDIESSLLRADVGVQATDQVLEALRKRLNEEVVDPAEGLRFLKEQLRAILEEPIRGSGRDLLAPERGRLNVWLMVGVNGVGKTTTLGKLANLAVRSGYSCLIAAADTFRAAAVQQVSVWGERSGVPVVSNPSANADPAAVVFDAIGAAKAKGTELVLVDTAGRLQTKHNLMEELSKVRRIVDRLAPEAVVESLLVLDASQGQNGLRQAMAFASAAGLTGVVITKLDGSARGGVALAVASEARLPIRFIGAGETIRDLRPFNSFEFVEALLGG
jgi:fused signal recognition particle receptor